MKHPVLLLATAPLMGALFVISLPIIGFALFGYAAALKLADGIAALDKKVNEA